MSKNLSGDAELPRVLVKAIGEPADLHYVCGLRDGSILFFERAAYTTGSEWITLNGLREEQAVPDKRKLLSSIYEMPSVEVRITEIAWVAERQRDDEIG